MRHRAAALLLLVVIGLTAATPAAADPRMETNHNFCHFILDPAETDNEVFAAGCNASIVTTVLPPATGAGIACLNAVARGYGEQEAVVPQRLIGLPAGSARTFTSDDSDEPCTMVESNGRAYRSHTWRSTITVAATAQPGMVKVRYTLMCLSGRP